jgi:uncharacterized protein (TIGR02996 family)
MLSDYHALCQSIIHAPHEDLPRLVLADWLEEQGQFDRAELIRVQVQLQDLNESDSEYSELHQREQGLLSRFQVEWKSELPEIRGLHWEAFDRGFVGTVRIDDPEILLNEGPRLFAATPITRLRLHRTDPQLLARIVQMQGIQHLIELDLGDGNYISNQGAEAIANSPYLSQLRELKLRSNRLGPAGVRALTNSPFMQDLRILDLDRNDLYDEGLDYLRRSTNWPQLRQLSLGWTQVGNDGAEYLAQAETLKNLQFLYLSGNRITDAGAIALANSPHLHNLRALYLDGNRISDGGAISLANSEILESMKWLYLKRNQIGDSGGHAFAASKYLTQVQELILGENLILAAGPALRDRFGKAVWLW